MSNILATYLYGSHVYKTNDELSDTDFIIIVDHQKNHEGKFADNLDVTTYALDYFQHLVDEHSVSALECIFLPETLKIELVKIPFHLDLGKLRRSFSTKASNSWVKAKKKIDLHGEYRIGRKSLFHSLRILNFGIQIATHGRIISYTEMSSVWELIQKQNFENWESYKNFWQNRYNNLHSEFKKLAPLE